MENFYDMTHVSKSVVDKNKRIEQQTADYLKKYNENLKEEMEAKETKALNEAMSGARYGYASSVARSKNRVNKLSEEIKYTNESSIIGMTEMVAEVVEKGLLLDEAEFAKIYPEYKKDIRGIVKGFLKEAEINENITNKDTLALMEYVSKTLPGTREGVSLTEDDLANYIAYRKPVNIDKSIRNLSGDVASNVALLMEKEQEKNEKIDKDVKRAQAKTTKKAEKKDEAMTAKEIIDGLESGKLTEEEVDAMLQDGEITQDTYDAVVSAYEEAANDDKQPVAKQDMTTSQEAPAEEEMDPEMAQQAQAPMGDPNAQMPVDPSMAGGMATSDMASTTGMPKKQIQMLPDGTMNVNIFESQLNEDHISKGLGFGFTKSQQYDDDMMIGKATGNIKSLLGPMLLSLIPYIGLPANIVAIIRGVRNQEFIGSSKLEELKKIVYADKECKEILDSIHKELLKDKPDKNKLKSLRQRFQGEVQRVKRTATGEPLKECFDAIINYNDEFTLVRETPRCGLVESLAVNEANKMLSEGKEYDGDLCLAKAIMYVTITEAMDTMGLMNVDEKKYSEIAAAAGGSLYENLKQGLKDETGKKMNNYVLGQAIAREKNPKNKETAITAMKNGRPDVAEKVLGTRKIINTEIDADNKIKKLVNAGYKTDGSKKESLSESILVSQYVPVLNNRTDADSLAEKIRRKRLNEQQTLHD